MSAASNPHLPYEASEIEYEQELYERLDQAEGAVSQADQETDDGGPDPAAVAALMTTLVGSRLAAAGLNPNRGNTPQSENDYQWFDEYVADIYEQGRSDARDFLEAQGYNVPNTPGIQNSGTHQTARAKIFDVQRSNLRRLADDLEDEIDQAVREAVDQGGSLADARRAARDRFDKVGRTRAAQIAQTETARAYNWALISEYEEAGVQNVTIQEIEWQTAGDDRVCASCRSAAGTYTIDNAKKMLKNGITAITKAVSSDLPKFPHHVGCRCILVPA